MRKSVGGLGQYMTTWRILLFIIAIVFGTMNDTAGEAKQAINLKGC